MGLIELMSPKNIKIDDKNKIIEISKNCLLDLYFQTSSSIQNYENEKQKLFERLDKEYKVHFSSNESQVIIYRENGIICGSAVLYDRGEYIRVCHALFSSHNEIRLKDILKFLRDWFPTKPLYGLLNSKLEKLRNFYKNLNCIEGPANLLIKEQDETRTDKNGWISIRFGDI